MAGRLEGRVALVTGAAKGIGKACCRALAAEGAPVALADIDREGGEALAAELAQGGAETMFIALDVTQEADWEAAIPAIVDRFGGLDVLVNNAGVGIIEPLPEVTLESWRKSMSVNVDGVFLGTKHAMGAMRAGGSIINISSILGFTSIPGLSAYSASKGAVRLFSKGAALDGAKDERRIRVNSIHPGYIHTEMMEATCYRDYGSLEAGLAGAREAAPHRPGRQARGHRQRRGLPGLGGIELHHRHRAGDRRRLPGGRRLFRRAIEGAARCRWRRRHPLSSLVRENERKHPHLIPALSALPGLQVRTARLRRARTRVGKRVERAPAD